MRRTFAKLPAPAIVTLLVLALAGCGGSKRSGTPPARIQPQSGRAVAALLDADGTLVRTVTGDGGVSAATADGHGGWFVGGSFTQVGGQRARGLAHLFANGAIDPHWHAGLTSSRPPVLAVLSSTLFAAGWIDDSGRSTLSAIDAGTGAARAAPALAPFGVDALLAAGPELLVAQETGTAERAPSCLTAYDTRTNRPLAGFSVNIRMQPELGCINSLSANGGLVYLAGYFQAVDGVPRPGVARLQLASGALDRSWRPPRASCSLTATAGSKASCYRSAYAVAATASSVFVGGASPGVLALSATSGASEPGWRAPSTLHNAVPAAVLGRRLFVYSPAAGAGTAALGGFAVLNVADGSLLASWHPTAGTSAIAAAASGSRVLVGLHVGR